MRHHIQLFTLICFSLITTSCIKQDTSAPKTTLNLRFTNEFAGQPLQLNKTYTTLLNDEVEFTTFNYYISNIQLKKADGSVWVQPESYHLLKVTDANAGVVPISLTDVPQGQYAELIFSVGVDAVRNSSGAQEGALDPINGMFWTWKTGYMFLRSEGFYIQNEQKQGAFVYHTGDNTAYQTVTLALNNVTLNTTNSEWKLKADAQQLFGGFTGAAIDLAMPAGGNSVTIKGGAKGALIANNYKQMFSLGDFQK
ncbi:MbnP family protein [Microscilla marina]|uniref:Lipoprotein, putative n=1 Tax=Microscilla marina ATCC 23134 TaxID=313606 RepID=A1ZJH9_MICM2|nr:MbnP family protein [Microscilla marina]EAY29282.1 lipoprotein, putative [Microscilla marina ATCC 23134]